MKITDTRSPKACFMEAGQVVQLITSNTFIPEGPFYLVVRVPDGKKAQLVEAALKSNGLYSDPRTYLLVNLETGELRTLPHLSSRVDIIDHAELVLKDRSAKTADDFPSSIHLGDYLHSGAPTRPTPPAGSIRAEGTAPYKNFNPPLPPEPEGSEAGG